MAVYEDPIFVKALKHLHSTAKDSTLQIFHLLEETINIRYAGTKFLNPKLHNLPEDTNFSLEVPKHRGSRGPSPVLHIPSEKSSRSSTPPSEPLSIRTSPDRDDDELPLEIFEDDLFCTVCKGIRVTSDNRLLECNDCHLLYHQECHQPPVEYVANDPRFVWSCGDCTSKNSERVAAKAKVSSEPSKKHKSEAESESSSKKHKSEPDVPSESSSKRNKSENDKTSSSSSSKSGQKRSEKNEKSSKSSSHSSVSKDSKGSSRSSKSDSRSSSKSSGSSLNFSKQPGSPNSKAPSCKANIIAADKRIQNMKKKAAAKMQEKRSNPK